MNEQTGLGAAADRTATALEEQITRLEHVRSRASELGGRLNILQGRLCPEPDNEKVDSLEEKQTNRGSIGELGVIIDQLEYAYDSAAKRLSRIEELV